MNPSTVTDPKRRDEAFRLLDLIVFIAATAFAFAAIRMVSNECRIWTTRSHSPIVTMTVLSLGENLRNPVLLALFVLILLTAWSAALGACGVWRRERRFKAIFLNPGLLACGAVLSTLALTMVFHQPMKEGTIVLPPDASFQPPWEAGTVSSRIMRFLIGNVGIGVLIAWGALVVGRAWRKPSGWVEWTALAVGTCWIAIGIGLGFVLRASR